MINKILIIEDDQTVNDLLCENLRRLGYQVAHAYDGEQGLNMALESDFELILLDVMMPKLDGFEVLQSLRQHKSNPVLMLTAKGAEQDRITGFKTGADDYLTKPFSMTELELRIEAILRRTDNQTQKTSTARAQNSIQFDKQSGQVTIQQQQIAFTPIEFDLLFILVNEQGNILSKAYLYQSVLLREFSRYDRTLDMHISKIRKKITSAGMPVNTIKTVRGQGYCFEAV
jgi:two-component system response regulator PfeR